MYTAVVIIVLLGLPAGLLYHRYGMHKKKTPRLQTDSWIKKHYFGNRKWVFTGLAATFSFMAATGFLFSFFGLIRLQGIPLILHVSAGGFFAAAAASAVLVRTKDYRLDNLGEKPALSSRKVRRTAAYWVFMLAAFLLMASALVMMLSFFHFTSIRTAFFIHRWSALAAWAAAVVWVEAALIPEENES